MNEIPTSRSNHQRIGVFLALIASFSFATATTFTAFVSKKVGPYILLDFRFIVQAIIMIPFILRQTSSLYIVSKLEWFMILLSGILLSLSNVFAYLSVSYIPVVDAIALYNFKSMAVLLISRVWLKEQIRYLEISMMVIIILGVILISQPYFVFGERDVDKDSGLNYSLKGYAMMILAAILVAFVLCTTRRVNDVPSPILLYIQSLSGISTMLVMTVFEAEKLECDSIADILYLVGIIFFEVLGRTMTTESTKYIESNLVVVLHNFGLVFGLFYQLFLLKIFPNFLEIIGAIILSLAVTVLTYKHKIYDALSGITFEIPTRLLSVAPFLKTTEMQCSTDES